MCQPCLADRSARTSVGALATSLGISRRTLLARCEQHWGFPPGVLIMWAKLLLAGQLIISSTRTVESIANDMQFSIGGLHNGLRRYVGIRASALRAGGRLEPVLEALKRCMRPGRESLTA